MRISDPRSGASKQPMNPLWSWIHRFLDMHHDPGRSLITGTDPDLDHLKLTQPR